MLHEDYYGDQFKWFIGVVREVDSDRSRVKVRIFGIHHMDDKTNVSDGDLQYANILYPTTGAQTGSGNISHNLKPGTWVMGFFADGDDCQQPVVVGVFNGGVNAQNGGTSASGVTPGSPGSGADNGAGNTGETINIPGNGNLEKGYNFFRKKIEDSGQSSGDVHAQVSGILGNLMVESNSDSLNPRAVNRGDGRDGSDSVGIAQWNSGRAQALYRMYGNTPTVEQQFSFIWHEFQTSEKYAFNRIMTAKNVSEATAAMLHFERPSGHSYKNFQPTAVSAWDKRLRKAYQVYNSIKYTAPDGRNRQQQTQ